MSVLAAAMAACCPATDRFLLDVLDRGDDLALLDVVAFLDGKAGDAAHGGGAQVHVGLGLDLAGSAHHRGQILAHDRGSQHLGVARLLLDDHEGNEPTGNQTTARIIKRIFFMSDACSEPSLNPVYAIALHTVPGQPQARSYRGPQRELGGKQPDATVSLKRGAVFLWTGQQGGGFPNLPFLTDFNAVCRCFSG